MSNQTSNTQKSEFLNRLKSSHSFQLIVLLLFTLLLFVVFRKVTYPVDNFPIVLLSFITIIIFALATIKITYEKIPKSFSYLLRGITFLLTFYIAVNNHGYVIGDESVSTFLTIAKVIAVIFGLLSIFRPSFALLPIMYTVWSKNNASEFTGFKITTTDYMPVVELGLFLYIGLFVFLVVKQKLHTFNLTKKNKDLLHPLYFIFILAIAIHFGNYFYSGVAKLALDGGPLSWILGNPTNPTQFLVLNSNESGHFSFSHLNGATEFIYGNLSNIVFLTNLLTLVGQLVAIFALGRVAWAIGITLFYDVMHIIIYLATGIFFWKWILLNLTIVLALKQFPIKKLPELYAISGSLIVLLGTHVFFTAWLGWYDTITLVHTHVEAVDNNGSTYRVPSNYF